MGLDSVIINNGLSGVAIIGQSWILLYRYTLILSIYVTAGAHVLLFYSQFAFCACFRERVDVRESVRRQRHLSPRLVDDEL